LLKRITFVFALYLLLGFSIHADFNFILLTDTHILSDNSSVQNQRTALCINEINTFSPKPAFIVNTGDVTEAGLASEYEKYVNILFNLDPSIAKYEGTPGNHDVTRGMGLVRYRDALGYANYSFDYGGYKFIILSAATHNFGDGHFSRLTLTWLKNILQNLSTPDMPIITFWHFPTKTQGRIDFDEGLSIDNIEVLENILKDYNIYFHVFGHSHANYVYYYDNIPGICGHGTWDSTSKEFGTGTYGGCNIFYVTQNKIEVRAKPINANLQPPRFTLTLPKRQYPKITIISPKDDEFISIGEICKFVVHVEADDVVDAKYQIDDGGCEVSDSRTSLNEEHWRPMNLTPDKKTAYAYINFAEELQQLDAKLNRSGENVLYYVNGVHRLRVRIKTADGQLWYKSCFLHVTVRTDLPTALWRKDLAADIQADIYVSTNNVIYVNPYGAYFYAIDARNGQIKWKFDKSQYSEAAIQGPFEESSAPTVAEGKVFFGSYNGKVYCLDMETGRLLWYYQLPKEPYRKNTDTPTSVFTPVTYHNGVIYFGGIDGYLYAVNASDGSLKWRYRAKSADPAGTPTNEGHKEIESRPLVYNNKVFFNNWAGYVYAINLDGTEAWKKQIVTSFYLSPARSDIQAIPSANRIFCTKYSGGVVAINAEDGSIAWEGNELMWGSLGGKHNAPENCSRVYAKRATGLLCAYEASGNTPVWTINLGYKDPNSAGDALRNHPVELNNIVYTGSRYGGMIYAIEDLGNAARIKWKYKAGVGYVISSPWPTGTANDIVYVGTMDGHIVAIRKGISVPAAPQNLIARRTPLGKVELSWEPPQTGDPPTQYNLYRTTSNTGPWDNSTLLATILNAETQYRDSAKLTEGTYYYAVRAKNSAGESIISNIATVEITTYTPIVVPNPPQNLTAKSLGIPKTLHLSWEPPQTGPSPTYYNIYRATTIINQPWDESQLIATVLSPGTTHQDAKNLQNGVTYYYAIRAGNENGLSEISNVASAVPIDKTPPKISNILLSPQEIIRYGSLFISFTVNEELSLEPEVIVNSEKATKISSQPLPNEEYLYVYKFVIAPEKKYYNTNKLIIKIKCVDLYGQCATESKEIIYKIKPETFDFHVAPNRAVSSSANKNIKLVYELPEPSSEIKIKVYTLAGENIKTFNIGERDAGYWYEEWDCCDNNGEPVPSGVYFIQYISSINKKMDKLFVVR